VDYHLPDHCYIVVRTQDISSDDIGQEHHMATSRLYEVSIVPLHTPINMMRFIAIPVRQSCQRYCPFLSTVASSRVFEGVHSSPCLPAHLKRAYPSSIAAVGVKTLISLSRGLRVVRPTGFKTQLVGTTRKSQGKCYKIYGRFQKIHQGCLRHTTN